METRVGTVSMEIWVIFFFFALNYYHLLPDANLAKKKMELIN
jgi:hypothetical protein